MISGLLTKSRLAAARQCQRLHDLTYLRGYRPVSEAQALRFGTLIHTGLEQIWRGQPLQLPELGVDEFDLARARPMLRGYLARWDLSEYEVLGVEQEFETELVNPSTGASSRVWRLGGKLDAVVRERKTGRILIVEHKTSGVDISPGSTYWARLRMDAQVSIYFAGARSLGYDVAGLVYDVLGKPRLRPYEAGKTRSRGETAAEFELRVTMDIAENPTKYYQRGEIVRLEAEMTDAMVDVWDLGKQLRESERLGRSQRNPDACEKWGRMCPFFGACTGSESLDDQRLFTRSDNVHPELSGPAKEELPHGISEATQAPP